MKINYILSETLCDGFVPDLDSETANIIQVPHNQFVREEQLVFGPIYICGPHSLVADVEMKLRALNWPDLTWPFNQKKSVFSYSCWRFWEKGEGWIYFDNFLNKDFELWYYTNDCDFENRITPKALMENNFQWPLWIRSEAGDKSFSGGVFNKEQFEKEYEYLKQNNKTDIWLVVSKPKHLEKEWRLYFVSGEYVSGSQYMNAGEIEEISDVPQSVIDFGSAWAAKYQNTFGAGFVLDVCEHLEKIAPTLKILEINSIKNSGFYLSDKQKIFAAIEKQIKKEIKR